LKEFLWKQSWKKSLKEKKPKKTLVLKDLCPEYLKFVHHANGWKTATTANAQHS